MNEVALYGGAMTLIDSKHYLDVLNAGPWRLDKDGYAMHSLKRDGRKTTERLHQFIAKLEGIEGQVDHIDCDPLNNTVDNLRVATQTENAKNKRIFKSNSSGVKGVYFNTKQQKYHAQITFNSRRIHLGFFDDLEEAANAYQEASQKYHGEFGRTE